MSDVDNVLVMGIPLRALPPGGQFLLCLGAVMAFYVLYGLLKEFLFNAFPGFRFGFFFTLFQFVCYALFSAFHRSLSRHPRRMCSMKAYMFLSACMVLAMGLANEALVYLTYPTEVLFKSCKLIFVMATGVFMKGRRYNRQDCLAAGVLVLGLLMLGHANARASVVQDQVGVGIGVGLVLMALVFDGIGSNVQEYILQDNPTPVLETIFYSYAVGAGYLVVVCAASGQLIPGIRFCLANPMTIAVMLGVSLMGYLGVQFFLALIKLFGAMSAVVVTVVLSFLVFPKPFSWQHCMAICLVAVGVGLDVHHKSRVAVSQRSRPRRTRARASSSPNAGEAAMSRALGEGWSLSVVPSVPSVNILADIGSMRSPQPSPA